MQLESSRFEHAKYIKLHVSLSCLSISSSQFQLRLFSIKLDCLGLVQGRKDDNSAEQIA